MKAITIHQPWAWLIVHGFKRIENRTRRTSHRGPIAIHAGQSTATIEALVASGEYRALQRRCPGLPEPADLVRGAVVGEAKITDAVPMREDLGPFAIGPWCWKLAGAWPYETPVPAAGKLSLWEWERPAAVLAPVA